MNQTRKSQFGGNYASMRLMKEKKLYFEKSESH